MKIVVCVRGGALSPSERAAVGLAAGLGGAAELIALSASSPVQKAGLCEALALGVGRAVCLDCTEIGATDSSGLGALLAGAIVALGGELVLAGARSSEEGRGAVPAAIAEGLGASFVAGVEALVMHGEGAVAASVRGGGFKRRLAVSPPAVLAVSAAARPAPPPAPPPAPVPVAGPVQSALRSVPEAAVEVLSLADVGLDPDVTRRHDDLLGVLEAVPSPRPSGPLVVDSADALLRALLGGPGRAER